MKQSSLISSLILLFILVLPACKEDVYMDWKLKNELWTKNLVETHKNDTNFFTTSSGLSYKVVYQGWHLNRKPNVNSTIRVKYTGKLIDGSTFDSSNEAILSLAGVIEGWREGITKMNDGGNYILYVPSSLGYDTASTNVKIPPHSTLIFDIDLMESQN